MIAILILVYHVFVAFAVRYNIERAIPVLVVLVLGYLYVIYSLTIESLASKHADKIKWVEAKLDRSVEFQIRGFPVLKG